MINETQFSVASGDGVGKTMMQDFAGIFLGAGNEFTFGSSGIIFLRDIDGHEACYVRFI